MQKRKGSVLKVKSIGKSIQPNQMKRVIRIIFFILVTIVPLYLLNQNTNKWIPYTSKLDSFYAEFPIQPQIHAGNGTILGNNSKYRNYLSKNNQNESFMVGVISLPEGYSHSQEDETLKAILQDLIISSNGKIISSSRSTYMESSSEDYEAIASINSGEKLYIEGRIIIVNNKIYHLMVTNYNNKPNEFSKFINSFKYLKN